MKTRILFTTMMMMMMIFFIQVYSPAEGKLLVGMGIFSDRGVYMDLVPSLSGAEENSIEKFGSLGSFVYREMDKIVPVGTSAYKKQRATGRTAIYSATEHMLDLFYSSMQSADPRPEKACFVLLTDGQETFDREDKGLEPLGRKLDGYSSFHEIPLERIIIRFRPEGQKTLSEKEEAKILTRLKRLAGQKNYLYQHRDLYEAESELNRLFRSISTEARDKEQTIAFYFLFDRSESTKENESEMLNAIQSALEEIVLARRPEFEGSMRFVQGGLTDIGDDKDPSASPRHQTTIDNFHIAKTEVTNWEWYFITRRYVPGLQEPAEEDKQKPKVNISWDEAILFCNRLSEFLGRPAYYSISEGPAVSVNPTGLRGVRLPREQEYEFLLRLAWKGSPGEANLDSNGLLPVGSFPANPPELFDLFGNALEWTDTVFAIYGSTYTDTSLRVLRGGGFLDSAETITPSYRHWNHRTFADSDIGFRICYSH